MQTYNKIIDEAYTKSLKNRNPKIDEKKINTIKDENYRKVMEGHFNITEDKDYLSKKIDMLIEHLENDGEKQVFKNIKKFFEANKFLTKKQLNTLSKYKIEQ